MSRLGLGLGFPIEVKEDTIRVKVGRSIGIIRARVYYLWCLALDLVGAEREHCGDVIRLQRDWNKVRLVVGLKRDGVAHTSRAVWNAAILSAVGW